MDRDKIFVELTKGLLSNPNLVRDQYSLNMPSKRTQIIEVAKAMTNLVMTEITDEEDNDGL